ncbi:MAG: MFS transporter [Bacteroidia bacterium]
MIKRYPISFWLLNLSTLLFFFSFNVIIPEMPDYLTSLGGEDYKGFIIGLFTIVAAISRPISGKLTDLIGRLPVMFFGGIICVIVSFLYPWFATIIGFMMLRFFHGMSTGFIPTGTVAYLADIIPSDRRGEAMGIVGIMNNVGFMAGNASSSLITERFGVNGLFYLSAILALLSVAALLKLKESMVDTEKFKIKQLKINLSDVYDKRVFEPAVVMILTTMTFGAMLTLIPDYSKHLGIMNKGLFLSIATVSTILIRLWAGKLSDRIGRLKTCIVGTSFWVVASLLLSSLDINMFYLAAIFTGMATGMNSPAVFAWAVDVAKGIKSGRAMATLFISLEVGITIGAFVSAAIYRNHFENLQQVFLLLTVFNVLALLFLINKNRSYSSDNQ